MPPENFESFYPLRLNLRAFFMHDYYNGYNNSMANLCVDVRSYVFKCPMASFQLCH